MTHGLHLRRATPDDAALLAEASLIASRAHVGFGLYDAALPSLDDAAKLVILQQLAAAPNCSFHSFEQRWIAELDGEPAGSISAFESGPAADAALGGAVVAAVPPELLRGVGAARATFALAAPPHPDGVWVLELVATFPAARRRGVGGALVEAAVAQGRQLGYDRASVMYELGNEAAALTYRAAGFEVVEERRHAEFERVFRCPGTARAGVLLRG